MAEPASPGPEAVEQLRAGVADLLVAQPYLQVFCSEACLRRFLVARRGAMEDAIASLRCAGTSLCKAVGQRLLRRHKQVKASASGDISAQWALRAPYS